MIGADIAKLQESLPIQFNDISLLQRAFIHRSYLNEVTEENDLADNERLEFLGDAVLGFVVSEELFTTFPEFQEGPLTNLRAALVRRETLSKLATQLNLGDYLWLGNGEEDSGGRDRPATLCAVFEALVGAIYIDQGTDAVRHFVLPLTNRELIQTKQAALGKDAKSRMQEYVQREFNVTPRYKETESSGPDHDKTFVMTVTVSGKVYGVGEGRSKGEATQSAAAMGLLNLQQHAPEYVPNPELEARYAEALAHLDEDC
ncbi:MAG: ribonuclease III [Caldilineaceae bacterium]|nr:ribonuclease III [Caldilineaceae bacterium]